jgi:hypothetical protein
MPLLQFAILQLLDAVTTLVFLRHGIEEANPLIRQLLAGGGPALALAGPKILALAGAFYAWRSGRERLLRRINVLFAACVAWNIVALLV